MRRLAILACTLFALAGLEGMAHAGFSGSFTNVGTGPGETVAGTVEVYFECESVYCGWYSVIEQVEPTEACVSGTGRSTWVGELGETPDGWFTEDFSGSQLNALFGHRNPRKLCLYAYHNGSYRFVAQATYTPTPAPPPPPPPPPPPAPAPTPPAPATQQHSIDRGPSLSHYRAMYAAKRYARRKLKAKRARVRCYRVDKASFDCRVRWRRRGRQRSATLDVYSTSTYTVRVDRV